MASLQGLRKPVPPPLAFSLEILSHSKEVMCPRPPDMALSVAEQSGMCKERSTASPLWTLVTRKQTIPTMN